MTKTKNIKIILGISYIFIVSIFLWFFFNNFSIQEFTSYELIKANRDISEEDIISLIKENSEINKYIKNQEFKKKVFVPNKLINIII